MVHEPLASNTPIVTWVTDVERSNIAVLQKTNHAGILPTPGPRTANRGSVSAK